MKSVKFRSRKAPKGKVQQHMMVAVDAKGEMGISMMDSGDDMDVMKTLAADYRNANESSDVDYYIVTLTLPKAKKNTKKARASAVKAVKIESTEAEEEEEDEA